MKKKPIDIPLESPIKYHYKNDEVEAKFITLSPFSMKHMDMVAPIREIVTKAISRLVESTSITADDAAQAKAEKEAKQEAGEKVDSSGLMSVIMSNCAEGDLLKLYLHMKKLLTSGVAYIDASDVKFSGIHVDELDPADFDTLCGEYIGNFIVS